MKRKDFLKSLTLAGTASFVSGAESAFSASKEKEEVDLVAILGGEPGAMLEKAFKELGGIGRYVKKGDRVTLKPNVSWDMPPEFGSNTHPETVSTMVRLCFEAGAKEVLVFDHTCDSNWRRTYETCGIQKAVESQGGTMVPGNDESYYREVALPNGKSLRSTKVHRAILDADVWFNMPVLKSHGGAGLTIAMKNLMGIVWDRRYFHSHDLHQCIADMTTFSKPAALHIVDAYRVMKSSGPRGGGLADVVTPKALMVSHDIVAVDTASTVFFNQISPMTLETVSHIRFAQSLKSGTMNLKSLRIKRVKM